MKIDKGNPRKRVTLVWLVTVQEFESRYGYFFVSLNLMTSIINRPNAIINDRHSYVLIIESPPPAMHTTRLFAER